MTSWTADIEVLLATDPSPEDLDRWMAELADHSPDFGISELSTSAGDALITATVTLEAETLSQAATDALQLVEEATGGRADGVMVFSTPEYEARVERPFIHRLPSRSLTGYAEIADIAGV